MSLPALAQNIAKKGRFGDNRLLHVSDAELVGLESLAGMKLPTNPDTGLPEAFFFLPFLTSLFGAAAPAAAGATAAGLGAAAAPAAAATALPAAGALGSGLAAGMEAASGIGALGSAASSALPAAAEIAAATAPAATGAASSALPAAAEVAAAAPAASSSLGAAALPELGIMPTVNPVAAASQPAASSVLSAAPVTPSSGFTAATTTPQMGDLAAGIGPQPFAATTPATQAPGVSAINTAAPQASSPVQTAAQSNILQPSTMGGPEGMMSEAPELIGPVEEASGGIGGLLGGGKFDLMQLAPLAMMMPRGGGGSEEDEDWGDVPEGYEGGDPAFPGEDYEPGIDPEWDYFPNFADGGMVGLASMGPFGMIDELFKGRMRTAEKYSSPMSYRAGQMPRGVLSPMSTGDANVMDFGQAFEGMKSWNAMVDKRNQQGQDAAPQQAARQMVMPPSDYQAGIDPQWNYFPEAKEGGLVKTYNRGGKITAGAGSGEGRLQKRQAYQTGGMVNMEAPVQPNMPMVPGQPVTEQAQPMGGLASLMQPNPMSMPEVPDSQVGSPYGAPSNPQQAQQEQVQDEELIAQTVEAIQGKHPNPEPVILAFVNTFGEQALQDLVARVKNSAGQGQGDGMSDSVPAMIDGQQPAALSEGEYVVPADVVSGLGNGSTDAGASALEDMSEKVRAFRNGGRVSQPPAINPRKVMPV